MAEKIELTDLQSFDLELKDGRSFLNGKERPYHLEKIDEGRFLMIRELRTYTIEIVETSGDQLTLKVNGKELTATYKSQIVQMLDSLGMSLSPTEKVNSLKAPMPGAILEILCNPGDEVKKGDSLLILEAMKMENVIKSPGEGVVDILHIIKGQNVEKNQALITFK